MEILMSVVIGIMFSVAVYLLMSRNLIRVVMGTLIMSHSIHLLFLTLAGVQTGGPPLLDAGEPPYTDPLPQALVLTAIVIAFGVTALLATVAYKTYKAHNTVDLEELRGEKDE